MRGALGFLVTWTCASPSGRQPSPPPGAFLSLLPPGPHRGVWVERGLPCHPQQLLPPDLGSHPSHVPSPGELFKYVSLGAALPRWEIANIPLAPGDEAGEPPISPYPGVSRPVCAYVHTVYTPVCLHLCLCAPVWVDRYLPMCTCAPTCGRAPSAMCVHLCVCASVHVAVCLPVRRHAPWGVRKPGRGEVQGCGGQGGLLGEGRVRRALLLSPRGSSRCVAGITAVLTCTGGEVSCAT